MSEEKKHGRKLGLAILVSLFLHLAIGFSLAAFGNVAAPTIPPDETPSELTIMDLSPAPPVEKNPQFVDVDKSKESAEKPKDQTFESNANSLAASEKAPTGDLPLPSQDGKDLPTRDLETHDFSLQTEGSQPQPKQPEEQPESKPAQSPPPKSKPSEPPKLTPSPAPSATPSSNRNNWRCSRPRRRLRSKRRMKPSPRLRLRSRHPCRHRHRAQNRRRPAPVTNRKSSRHASPAASRTAGHRRSTRSARRSGVTRS